MMKISLLLLFVLTYLSLGAQFENKGAFISEIKQVSELVLVDKKPQVVMAYQIRFKYNTDAGVKSFDDYTIYSSYFDEITEIKAYTKYQEANGKEKKINIKDFKSKISNHQGIFHDDSKQIEIEFPNLQVGSEAFIQYEMIDKEPHHSRPMHFGSYLPVKQYTYQLFVPEDFDVSIIERNITPKVCTYSKAPHKGGIMHTWTANNIDEYKPLQFMPSYNHYMPHVLYKINSYKVKGQTIPLCSSVKDYYAWCVSNVSNVNKDLIKLKPITDSITQHCKTDEEKVKVVFQWVQKNVKYIAFEAGLEGIVPREGVDVCRKRYGDCKDMSSVQYAMLNSIGIPVKYVWIGTRDIPYDYTEIPLKNSDNHMIAAVKLNNKWIFLDATDNFSEFGYPANHIQGKQALIGIDNANYEIVRVPVVPSSFNYSNSKIEIDVKGNDLEVQSKVVYYGYDKYIVDYQYLLAKETERRDFALSIIKTLSNNAVLNSYTTPDKKNANDSLYTMNYVLPNYVKSIEQEKYININMDYSINQYQTTEKDRAIPLEFDHNYEVKMDYTLNIPEGYEVTYVPENSSFIKPEFGYKLNYSREKNRIKCSFIRYINLPNLFVETTMFNNWNAFLNQAKKAYKEYIIIKKK
jgi:hypothetical protein